MRSQEGSKVISILFSFFFNSPNSSVTTTDEDLVLFYFPEHMESEGKILNIKFKPDWKLSKLNYFVSVLGRKLTLEVVLHWINQRPGMDLKVS